MATRSKRIDVSLIGEVLARKKKADIFLFIPDRKTILECSFVANPSAPEAEFLINVRAIRVKRFVLQALNHGDHERRVLTRESPADYTNDARHTWITEIRGQGSAAF